MPWCFITDACAAYILHAYRKQSQKVPVRELELGHAADENRASYADVIVGRRLP